MTNISFKKPSASSIAIFIKKQNKSVYSYEPIGGTKSDQLQATYDNDYHSVLLGNGEEVWEKAKKALLQWQQFPTAWTKATGGGAGLEAGNTVAVLFRLLGIWWINAARIVYSIDEKDKFGFAYGTLSNHIEKGEECFWIERASSGAISYHIKAFSRPNRWFVSLVYPFARFQQRRFVKQSMAQMQAICK